MSVTPYMNLTLPTVSATLGPLYATQNNSAFTTVDSHNHTSGQGIAVPTAGVNIDADLTFGSYNATALRSTRYTAQGSPLALVTDRGCIYVSGVDMWFNDGSGNQIQLTASGALNAASIGGIGGDYTTSTASVAYSDSTKTFSFLQDTNKSALMDMGTILLRRTDITSSAATTIQANGSLTVGYTVTLPSAVPASTSIMLMDSSGNISFSSNANNIFTSGTVLLFYQAAAPTGWTRVTTQNDKFIRVVSAGSPGTAGGVNAASTNLQHTHTGPSHTHTSAAHSHSLDTDAWARWAHDNSVNTIYWDRASVSSWTADRRIGSSGSESSTSTTESTGIVLDGDTNSTTPGSTGASGTAATGSAFTSGSFAYLDVLIASKD